MYIVKCEDEFLNNQENVKETQGNVVLGICENFDLDKIIKAYNDKFGDLCFEQVFKVEVNKDTLKEISETKKEYYGSFISSYDDGKYPMKLVLSDYTASNLGYVIVMGEPDGSSKFEDIIINIEEVDILC